MHTKHVLLGIAVGLGLLVAVALLVGSGPGVVRAASTSVPPATVVITGPVFLAKDAPLGHGTDCTQAHPCRFLQELHGVVSATRSTIYVAAGRYSDYVDGQAVISITAGGGWDVTVLGGWDGAPTGPIVRDPVAHEAIIDGQGSRRVFYVGPGAQPIIDGLTVTGGRASEGAGMLLEGSGGIISRLTITGNVATNYGGGIEAVASTPIITACAILSNSANFGAGGILVDGGALLLYNSLVAQNQATDGGAIVAADALLAVVGNRIVDNLGNSALSLANSNPLVFGGLSNNVIAHNLGQVIYVESYPLRLAFNTITGNSYAGIAAGLTATLTMTNNILADFDAAVLVDSAHGASATGTNNLFWSSEPQPWTGTSAVFGDPHFVNPGAGDYHLACRSAAIDRGVDVGVHTDLDGRSRPFYAAPDIGAYEFHGGCRALPLILRS